jgi:hypothetical protein
MSDESRSRTEASAGTSAPVRLLKRKAHIFTLLLLLCFPFSLAIVGLFLAWGNNVFESPPILAILVLNLALLSLATYFWMFEKESPARELWKSGSLAGQCVRSFLLLVIVVILLVVTLAIISMVTHKTIQIGPYDIGKYSPVLAG